MTRELLKKSFDVVLPEMGFKSRPEQVEYAMMVQDKLEMGLRPANGADAAHESGVDVDSLGVRPTFGAIEAGTGTGKTLGYLIPVLLHIALTGGNARITTHTLALQDQIYGRDALYADRQPDFSAGDRSDMAVALEVVYRLTGKRLLAGFRKGRQAYVSPLAVLELLETEKASGAKRSGEDAALASALRKWVKEVQALQVRRDALYQSDDMGSGDVAGDRLRLAQDMENDEFQGLVASFMDAHDGRLPLGITASEIGMVSKVNDNPFYGHHAGNSMDRDVLVVSHTLSLIDLQMGGNVLLPPAKVIVHDEADTMAGVAEMYARKKIRPDILRNVLHKAFNSVAAPDPVQRLDSLLTGILKWFSKEYDRCNPVDSNGFPLRETPVSEMMLDDKTVLTTSALDYVRMLQKSVTAVLALKVQNDASLDMMRFRAVLDRVHQELKLAENAFPANTEFGERQMRLSLDDQGLPKKRLDNGHLALGLTWSPVKKFPAFEVVDLYASRLFSKEWFFKSQDLETVLLTSATLRTPAAQNGKANEWDYISRLLGMPESSGRVASVKKFGQIVKIHLTKFNGGPFLDRGKDGETRYNSDWVANAQMMLVDMLKTGERGLVLASSFRDVKVLMEGFVDPRIWWQTDSKNMHWRDGVDALRNGVCQIMVTPSVWAGANIRNADGSQLFRHQGILRAPVAPGDVVREKALANYFRWKGLDNGGDPDVVANNTVRRMADQAGKHKMTQGLGRGIRSADDVIEVWLMDARLGQPQWQGTFPERFRGLFADPKVLRKVVTNTENNQPGQKEGGRRPSLLALLNSVSGGKPTNKSKEKGDCYGV